MFDGIRRAFARRRAARARKQNLTMKFSPGAPTAGSEPRRPYPLPTGLVIREELPPSGKTSSRAVSEEAGRIAREGRIHDVNPRPFRPAAQYPSLTELGRPEAQWYPGGTVFFPVQAPDPDESPRFYEPTPSCGQPAPEPVASDPDRSTSWSDPSPPDTGYSGGSSTSYDSGSSSSYDSGSSGGSSDSGSSSSSCD